MLARLEDQRLWHADGRQSHHNRLVQPVGAQRMASLWKRLLAAVIDWLPFIVPAVLSVSIGRERRTRRHDLVWKLVVRLLEGSYRILATSLFSQTIGQRLLRIRVVDEETGQRPTLRQSVVRWAMSSAPEALLELVATSEMSEDAVSVMRDLQPTVERLKSEHSGDRVGLNRAMMALYREHDIKPLAGCWRPAVSASLGSLYSLIVHAAAARAPLHQGLHDRAAKTLLIEED